ncbi:MAG TPA: serine hydrolase domain-containing protein [Melioribacteraceae bacterium]|nr:serine hydrolase domain-containing protein [Melioribacteraceae bacterium]
MKAKMFFALLFLFNVLGVDMFAQDEEILKSFENSSGISIGVFNEGKIIYYASSGFADIEKKITINDSTNFRLASFSKQFTAMCIMILRDEGKIDLKSSLCDIYSNFPEYGKKITIKHLLTHTSGLIDYEDLLTDENYQVLDNDVLNIMMDIDSTYFEPGTNYRYSNTAYALLAMIVEKISGLKYSDFLRKRIFLPVGMTNSVAFRKGENEILNRAFGYATENGNIVYSDQSNTSAVWGDGGIYSSVKDILMWDNILYSEKLISKSTLDEIYTGYVKTDRENTDYGFGWYIDNYKGIKRYYHTGETCGFRTVFQRYPDKHISIVVLANNRDTEVMTIANKIIEKYLTN